MNEENLTPNVYVVKNLNYSDTGLSADKQSLSEVAHWLEKELAPLNNAREEGKRPLLENPLKGWLAHDARQYITFEERPALLELLENMGDGKGRHEEDHDKERTQSNRAFAAALGRTLKVLHEERPHDDIILDVSL